MKMAAGGRPGTPGSPPTPTGGLIAAVEVDAIGSDMGKLRPMSDQLAEACGIRPAGHPACGGYARLDDIACMLPGLLPGRSRRGGLCPARERHAPRPGDQPAVAAWRVRMNTQAARAICKERAATAERVHARARNRGLQRLLVRGKASLEAVLPWFALARNMATAWRLMPA